MKLNSNEMQALQALHYWLKEAASTKNFLKTCLLKGLLLAFSIVAVEIAFSLSVFLLYKVGYAVIKKEISQ